MTASATIAAPSRASIGRTGLAALLALALPAGSGCMALSPQLPPTQMAELEQVEDREQREQLYAQNTIYRHKQAQGMRYTKGTSPKAEKRSWQSLDVILRSDANASEALPYKKLRLARLFTALGIAASVVMVAGIAASAREGLDLQRLDGTGGVLLGGGLATAAFGITAGILYSRARKDYDRAVDIYNDSLGVRLGLYTAEGKYIPPRGTLVDKDGFILLEQNEVQADEVGPQPEPAPQDPAAPELPASDTPASAPDAAPEATTPATPASPAPAAVTPTGLDLRMRH
ncbi:MAG: hypothetical protein U0168_22795 [Nannocystaceae bacterium]